MVWTKLMEVAVTGATLKRSQEGYNTMHPMHVMVYYLNVWLSVMLGGIFTMEQYFGKKLNCFATPGFSQPAAAISDYCWEHGSFATNNTQGIYEYLPHISSRSWLLHTYMYFFLKGFIFILPHAAWVLKYQAFMESMLKGAEGMLKELEGLWLKYSSYATEAYREVKQLAVADEHPEAKKAHNAVMAMTRDVVQITQALIPYHSSILFYAITRMLYDTLALFLFFIGDIILFLMCTRYNGTDFYCPLPNGEVTRCMVPMMPFLWQGAMLGLVANAFLMCGNLFYTFYLLYVFCCKSTRTCFLEQIPHSNEVAGIYWSGCTEKVSYKLISDYLLMNYAIIQPLHFLKAFVSQIKEERATIMAQELRSMPLGIVKEFHD